jgi:hypothetical protein
MSDLLKIENIEEKILVLRGQKVLLDRDLAKLYNVETRRLVEQVKRNPKRFPPEFMFQLSKEEFEDWRSQFAISNSDKMGLRRPPYAFSEHGVAMLSSILKSERAIQVNIAIIKTFIKMREIIKSSELINARLDDIEDRLGVQEFQTLAVLDQLGSIKKQLKTPKAKNKPLIGFSTGKK